MMENTFINQVSGVGNENSHLKTPRVTSGTPIPLPLLPFLLLIDLPEEMECSTGSLHPSGARPDLPT